MTEDLFIRNIRSALGVDPDAPRTRSGLFAPRVPGEAQSLLKRIAERTRPERKVLVERLETMARPLNLNVLLVNDVSAASRAVVSLVKEKVPEWEERKQVAAWRHPLVKKLDLAAALSPIEVPVVYAPLKAAGREEIEGDRRRRFREKVAASFVGVTSADYCVADSATLVMKARSGQPRSVSLLPSIHVAVIEENQMLADLKELYALLGHDPVQRREGLTHCMTFISGPSKTADIEAQMVHGAHGPRELHLVIIS